VQADAICIRRNRELAGAPLQQSSLSAIASSASRRAAIERRALEELGKLTPPPNTADRWRSLITDSRAILRGVAKLAEDASSSDSVGVREQLSSVKQPQFRLLVAGVHAGLRHCSSVG
jgi:hypothetical protein